MTICHTIDGLILAGGQARRMNHADKGLMLFKGKPLVSYAIAALKPLTQQIIISANRHQQVYQQFALPVIADEINGFAGPLAGIASAMTHSTASALLVVPCDVPYLQTDMLSLLLSSYQHQQVDVVFANDGIRLQPSFMVIRCQLKSALQQYLMTGQRQLTGFLTQQSHGIVNVSHYVNSLININNLDELAHWEQHDGNSN